MKSRLKKIYALIVILCIFNLTTPISQDCSGQEVIIEKTNDFNFWIVGNSAKPRFGEHWYSMLEELQLYKDDFNCLLKTIATEPHTVEEILAHCEMSPTWLSLAIDSLEIHNFLEKSGNSEIYSKIPILTNSEMKRVQESLRPIARNVAEIIKEDIPMIMQLYNELKTNDDPKWKDIAHLVIDKILIDGRFHRGLVVLERERGFKDYYSKAQREIPAYFMESGSQYGTFGVNWYRIKGQGTTRDVYFFHGGPLKRYEFSFNEYGHKKYFEEIFHRVKTNGSLEELTDDEIQIFKDLGWVLNDTLAIPFIQAYSLKVLYNNILKELGNKAANIVFERFSVILDSYAQSPYSAFSDGAGDYIQVCYHLLFASIIYELIELEALPPIPEPCPDYYGVYVTIGSFFD
ncbi:hypothetical protein ACFLRY_02955 [Bacteroidota bacterium]